MEPPRHAQDVDVSCPRSLKCDGTPVLTVDVSWTETTMQHETSSLAINSRNSMGQEVSHSDPLVGGLSKLLAFSHGALHQKLNVGAGPAPGPEKPNKHSKRNAVQFWPGNHFPVGHFSAPNTEAA